MGRAAAWAAVAAAGLAAAAWRRRVARSERVEVYFEDGSMVSFRAGREPADALLSPARDVLAAARA